MEKIKFLAPRTPYLMYVEIERYLKFFLKLLSGPEDGSTAMPMCLALFKASVLANFFLCFVHLIS